MMLWFNLLPICRAGGVLLARSVVFGLRAVSLRAWQICGVMWLRHSKTLLSARIQRDMTYSVMAVELRGGSVRQRELAFGTFVDEVHGFQEIYVAQWLR